MSNKTMVWVAAVVALVVLGVGGGLVAALVVGDDDEPSTSSRERETEEPSTTPPADPETDAPTGPAGAVPEGLEEYYSQQLDWESCSTPGNECATLTVPVDYLEPDGETVELALERTPASDQANRVGSLVVNPGGPGAPGTVMAESSADFFRPSLLERVDIVAFDPRGTGDSDPVDCLSDDDLDATLSSDPSPDDDAEVEEFVANQEAFFAGCVDNSDDLVGHVSTVEAARDMDVLRGVLGEETLRYLGFSYGTTLGSTYAELFPANVGPFVLDGATDPTLDQKEDLLSQVGGFQTALEAYVQDCVDGGDCVLGDSLDEGLTTIEDLLADIDESPLPTGSGRELQGGNAFYGLAAPLYSEESWPFLTSALEEALGGDGDQLLYAYDLYVSRDPLSGEFEDNSFEAISAINCLDDPSFVEPDEIPAQIPEFEEASRTFGEVFAWSLLGCYGLQVQAAEPKPEIRAEGAAPILVVGTTRDPATPYEEAVALSEQLESGVLLTRDGDGHTAYNKGNSCIDDAIEGFLLDGVVPDDGTEC